MNSTIDHVFVAIVVAISFVIVLYMLSPLHAKRWMLSKLSPVISVRIITKLLPNQCGCDGCPTASSKEKIRR
jgi:hypothetical protein